MNDKGIGLQAAQDTAINTCKNKIDDNLEHINTIKYP